MNDFFPLSTKRPRDYAADIAHLKTRDERRTALEAVPPDMQQLVKAHVTNTLSLVWFWRKQLDANPRQRVPQCVQNLLDEFE